MKQITIYDFEKEFEELMKKGQELIEKLRENQNTGRSKTKRWKPKNNEKYFYITPNFKLKAEYFEEQFDEECWNVGNCFKTEKEAQKELDRRIVEQELLDMCDWDGGVFYEIVYNIDTGGFDWTCHLSVHSSPYIFSESTSVQKAIDTLGTEKLKLIFRID